MNVYTSGRRLPSRYSRWGFWASRIILALFGGLLAYLYEINNKILAFHIGASTPLIIDFFARTRPTDPG